MSHTTLKSKRMYIPFENMPDSARVWVYQASRNLSDSEVQAVQAQLEEQVNLWAAHGSPLSGSVLVAYNRMVVVAVDEAQNAASGCSIDASTRWLKELSAEMSLDFFNRAITFWQNDTLKEAEMLQLKSMVATGEITPETLIFNNLVATISELKSNWQIPAASSWMKRYFVQVAS
jgi:hypothetical protein